jgi:hypothetical protein
MIYKYFKDKVDIIRAITIHNYDRIYREAFLLTTGVLGVTNMIVLNNLYDEIMITDTINGYVEILVKGVIK